MPNSKQAIKRLRQSNEQNTRNRAVKSEIKTWTKKTMSAIEEKDKEAAATCLRTVQAKLDKAAKKGVMHANTVARRKSLLMRKMQGLES